MKLMLSLAVFWAAAAQAQSIFGPWLLTPATGGDSPRHAHLSDLSSGPTLLTATNNSYADWKASFFTSAELNDPTISSDDADPDHDGQSNLQEYVAGTDPTDASSVLKIESILWNGVAGIPLKIRFTAMPNKSYTVQCQDYSGAFWIKLADVAADPAAHAAEVKDYGASKYGLRLYRIVTPQQP